MSPPGPTLHPPIEEGRGMNDSDRRSCPSWCVAEHDTEDEGGRRRHRGPTLSVPGVALRASPPHDVRPVELLIEMHADDDGAPVAVYIGDGVDGVDVTAETAERLVESLAEALRQAAA
jgi:hypothetical protein